MVELKNCLVCGKEFKPCSTCSKNIPEEFQWRRVVCCPEHFQYHLPIIKYLRNEVTKAEAKEMLQNVISTYGEIEFCNNIKAIAEEILAEDIVKEVADIECEIFASKTSSRKNRK